MLFLQQNLLGNALQQWLIAIGIAVAVIMAVGLIRSLAVRRLATLASRTANSIDDLLVFVIRKTHLLLVWLPAFWIRSEEHTSELQSLMRISYAVFCLKKKKYNEHENCIITRMTS